MEASIAIGFRIFYVILYLQHVNIILHINFFGQAVNILWKRTDDTDSSDVMNLCLDVFQRDG